MTMKCPNCGAADLAHDVRDMPYIYKGEATVFAQVAGDYCPACGEGVFDAATSRAISADMKAFGKQVNAAIVDPSFISTSINAKRRKFSVAARMPSHVMKMAKPNRLWPWSNCSKCLTAILICSPKCGRGEL
jgi:YgiT-type zinc finger domain-containing protein